MFSRFGAAWLFALMVSGSWVQAAEPQTPASPPNVLFIAIDDLRDWVHYLGVHPQVQTPNIDRLAARGESFTRSYCAAPVCNPSRTALLSGLRPWTSGVYDNEPNGATIVPPAPPRCQPVS